MKLLSPLYQEKGQNLKKLKVPSPELRTSKNSAYDRRRQRNDSDVGLNEEYEQFREKCYEEYKNMKQQLSIYDTNLQVMAAPKEEERALKLDNDQIQLCIQIHLFDINNKIKFKDADTDLRAGTVSAIFGSNQDLDKLEKL